MDSEEYGKPLWRAGEFVPAGTYLRVDDHSYRRIVLEQPGPLPPSYDGHVAFYCRAPFVSMINAQAGESSTFNRGEERWENNRLPA
jgi:hypothetical protein